VLALIYVALMVYYNTQPTNINIIPAEEMAKEIYKIALGLCIAGFGSFIFSLFYTISI